MQVKISDLLISAAPEELPGERQADNERLTAAVSQRIKEEKMKNNKIKKKTGRILLIAAVAAALSVAALASTPLHMAASDELLWPVSGSVTEVIGAYPGGSDEAAAVSEWTDYLASGAGSIGAVTQDEFEATRARVPEAAWALGAMSPEASNVLDEIAEKHGLAMPESAHEVSSQSELYSRLGTGDFLPVNDSRAARTGGTVLDTGSFVFNGAFTLGSGKAADYNFFCTVKGSMPLRDRFFADIDSFEQWTFTSGDTKVMLGAGDDMSVLYAETDNCWIVVNIRAGLESAYHESASPSHGSLTRSDLESFASGIDFSCISSPAAGRLGG